MSDDEYKERIWRDEELRLSDVDLIRAMEAGTSLDALKLYRQELRDWPSHADFLDPSKRPTLS